MLVPALDVSWGGYTITLTAIFGICSMVQWSDEWDFFINLSASDFPLLPQVRDQSKAAHWQGRVPLDGSRTLLRRVILKHAPFLGPDHLLHRSLDVDLARTEFL